jgi:hypothetical protein
MVVLWIAGLLGAKSGESPHFGSQENTHMRNFLCQAISVVGSKFTMVLELTEIIKINH